MKAIPLQRWKDGGHGEEYVVKPKCRICKIKIQTSEGQMYELHKSVGFGEKFVKDPSN